MTCRSSDVTSCSVSPSERASIAYRPPTRRGNNAMPLLLTASPRSGTKEKRRKSSVRSISGAYLPSGIGGVGGKVGDAAIILDEADEPRILNAVALLLRDREDDAFAQFGGGREGDIIGIRPAGAAVLRRGVVAKAAGGSRRIARAPATTPGAEADRADVTLAGGAQAHHEAQLIRREPFWSGCGVIDGLNSAVDWKLYSLLKKAPISSRRASTASSSRPSRSRICA